MRNLDLTPNATLHICTIVVRCRKCGSYIANPDSGSKVWAPDQVRAVQYGSEYRTVEGAPMCTGCGAFICLPMRVLLSLNDDTAGLENAPVGTGGDDAS